MVTSEDILTVTTEILFIKIGEKAGRGSQDVSSQRGYMKHSTKAPIDHFDNRLESGPMLHS